MPKPRFRQIISLAVASASWSAPLVAASTEFSTQHVTKLAGGPVRYQANVEQFVVDDAAGKPAARLVTTSYVRKDVGDLAHRPVVFLFNGGPSASAIGLHVQFGPLEECPAQDRVKGAAICFQDNPESLIDVADLVMFDPVETGYSRMLPGAAPDYFYSAEGDADALAQLVEQWLTAHHREHSPRYLLGESYGSIRQVLAADLLRKRGTPISGEIIFGDSIFLMETSRRTHNIVSTAASLPLLAMTAAFHGKADKHGKSDAAFLDEVYAFAMQDYLPALAKGYDLGEHERHTMAEKLQGYTGIASSYFLDNGLAIS